MAELVQPYYGFELVDLGDRIEVRYERVDRRTETVIFFSDRMRVGEKDYAKAHIGGIAARPPNFLLRNAGYNPPSPGGLVANVGFFLGNLRKKQLLKQANDEGWEVWFGYGQDNVPLAWGIGRTRAQALAGIFLRLARS